MRTEFDIVDRVVVIRVTGAITPDDIANLTVRVERILDDGHRDFVVGFSAVTFFTSAAVLPLARLRAMVDRRGGTLKLQGPTVQFLKTIRASVVDHLVDADQLPGDSFNHSARR